MQVTGPGNGVNLTQNIDQFKLGQRLLVEVVSQETSGLGIILLNGKEYAAELEVSVLPGQKFWAIVKEASQSGVLLVKSSGTLDPGDSLGSLGLRAANELSAEENEIHTLIHSFSTNKGIGNQIKSILSGDDALSEYDKQNFSIDIPQWAGLEENGMEKILFFLRKLGLNYEQRLVQAWRMPDFLMKNELISLQDTIKGRILTALNEPAVNLKSRTKLEKLLYDITGQQLSLQRGNEDNAFILLNLPLQADGKIFDIKIAGEGPWKGNKLDDEHFHLGIFTEMPSLGELGIEVWIHEKQLFLKLYTEDKQKIQELLESAPLENKNGFTKLGYNLEKIELATWEKAGLFRNFLEGQSRSGVDIQG